MSHVHDPPPGVLGRRPDVSPRLASSVARALEKDPGQRYPSMDGFVRELGACLTELGPTESQATAIMRAPSAARRRPAAEASSRRLRPLTLLTAGILVVLGAAAATVYLVERHRGGGGPGPVQTVELKAVSAFDPEGDRSEYGDLVGLATDGNAATYWRTERYLTDTFGGLKKGVGIVLDAGRPVRLAGLVVRSTTPGFRAVVKAGTSATGSFTQVSVERQAGGSTTFALTPRTEYRYYLLWLTRLPPGQGIAHVNEVTAG